MLTDLMAQLSRTRNAALITGAGISFDNRIPLGYALPMAFGKDHLKELQAHDLLNVWQRAADSQRWQDETVFVAALVDAFESDIVLQETVVRWLMDQQAMRGEDSDTHAVFVLAWLARIFRHLITTNWDFLLEWQIEQIYDEAYCNPFEPVQHTLGDGDMVTLDAERLFFLDALGGDDFFWSPRWRLVATASDLGDLPRWSRPVWKIHGSPFFLACPQCGGLNRWKRTVDLHVGQHCPDHPGTVLQPEIVFWGQGIDTAAPSVWRAVLGRLQRCDMIVVCGLSGSGTDAYIRHVVEPHPNAWVVSPGSGDWDVSRVQFVAATAADLAGALRTIL